MTKRLSLALLALLFYCLGAGVSRPAAAQGDHQHQLIVENDTHEPLEFDIDDDDGHHWGNYHVEEEQRSYISRGDGNRLQVDGHHYIKAYGRRYRIEEIAQEEGGAWVLHGSSIRPRRNHSQGGH